MPYLVDGSNLGGRLGGAAGARDRTAVLRVLLAFARGRRRVVVVFDGPQDAALARAYGPLEVRFAGARAADEVILGMLDAGGGSAADWWVVTEDRALGDACRARGARTMGSDDLLRRGARSEGAGGGGRRARDAEPPVDVADWEEWFRRGGS